MKQDVFHNICITIATLLILIFGLFIFFGRNNKVTIPEERKIIFNDKTEAYLVDYSIPSDNKEYFIICPGGGYKYVELDTEGVQIAKYINELGYNAFVLRYTTADVSQTPLDKKPLTDLANAINYLKKDYGDNYYLIGFSAGGHLASMMASEDIAEEFGVNQTKGLLLGYPVITLNSHKGSETNLIGEEVVAGEYEEIYNYYNVVNHITSNYPVTYVWRRSKDILVDGKGADLFGEKLEEKNVEHNYIVAKGFLHGEGLATDTNMNDWLMDSINYVIKESKKKAENS